MSLTLLQAVRDNPNLPQPIRDQAVAFAVMAIAEANNITTGVSTTSPMIGTSTAMLSTSTAATQPVSVTIVNMPQPQQPQPVPEVQAPTAKAAAPEQPTLYPNNCPFPDIAERNIIHGDGFDYDANTGIRVDLQTGKCI